LILWLGRRLRGRGRRWRLGRGWFGNDDLGLGFRFGFRFRLGFGLRFGGGFIHELDRFLTFFDHHLFGLGLLEFLKFGEADFMVGVLFEDVDIDLAGFLNQALLDIELGLLQFIGVVVGRGRFRGLGNWLGSRFGGGLGSGLGKRRRLDLLFLLDHHRFVFVVSQGDLVGFGDDVLDLLDHLFVFLVVQGHDFVVPRGHDFVVEGDGLIIRGHFLILDQGRLLDDLLRGLGVA